MNLIELDTDKLDLSKMNLSTFYERLFYTLLEDGNIISYGDFCARIMKNGITPVMKSLGIYKVTGARDTKKILVHPKLYLVMRTTIASNEEIAKAIIDLVGGKYIGISKFEILSMSDFLELDYDYPCSVDSSKCTYLIYNPDNKLHKIGRSTNIYSRLASLRITVSPRLELSAHLSRDVEGELHKIYMKNRVFGEWFDLSVDNILDIKNKYKFEIVKLYL